MMLPLLTAVTRTATTTLVPTHAAVALDGCLMLMDSDAMVCINLYTSSNFLSKRAVILIIKTDNSAFLLYV